MSESIQAPAERSVLSETLHLCIPATLGMLSQWVVGVVDLKMVGMLATESHPERGVSAIANVNIALVYNLAMVIAFEALAIGTQAVAARRWGEGDRKTAAKAMTTAVWIGALLSLVLTPLYLFIIGPLVSFLAPNADGIIPAVITGYLKIRFLSIPAVLLLFALRGWFNGVGNTRVVMVSVLLVNVLNVILNWFLIEGRAGFPRMEENGAALASTISLWVGLLMLLAYALFSRRHRSERLLRVKGDAVLRQRIVKIAFPAFIHHGLMYTSFMIFHSVITTRTIHGGQGAAAAGIVWHVSGLCFMISLGFGIAAATLMGQGLGSGRTDRATRGVWLAAWLGCVCTLVVSVTAVIFAKPIAHFFTADEEVARLCFWVLFINVFFQFLDNFGIVLGEAFKGAGMTKFVMAVELPLNFLCFLPISWLLGVKTEMGIIGAWLPLPSYAILLAVILTIAFRRGRWRRGFA